MNTLFLILLIIIILFYLNEKWSEKKLDKKLEKFKANIEQMYDPVNYNTLANNCNELTYSEKPCVIDTVVPKTISLCTKEDNVNTKLNNYENISRNSKDISYCKSLNSLDDNMSN
jgi:hypothetical protein